MFLFNWYIKLMKLIALVSSERSFHNLIEEGRHDLKYSCVLGNGLRIFEASRKP